ncbi:MAG: hypothetical protein AAGC58_05375, partial [Asticcacaulis sp.]
LRDMEVGGLHVEARDNDTHYSLAIATAVTLSPSSGETWQAAGDIYLSVGGVDAYVSLALTKTQKR